MDKRLERTFNENLRDIPCDPTGLMQYTDELKKSLLTTTDPKKRVSLLGEIGVHLRSAGELDLAAKNILEALKIITENQLGIKWEIQQKIRLAHVVQWQKNFKESNILFDEIISTCRSNPDAGDYLDFGLQHAGKNFFDQSRFKEALILFEQALELRIAREAPKDQINSTSFAIERTKRKLDEEKPK